MSLLARFLRLVVLTILVAFGSLASSGVFAQATLQITDKKVGTGAEAVDGSVATVHYTGWLTNGTKFDSSKDRGTPFNFTIGKHEVIPGWEEGVKGMKVGGVRELVIPPHLGYGSRGAGNVIPPNAVLKFEIELLNVRN
jgi:FKBP-type peptidyl-prolyl cis-trans isomerase